MYTFRLLTIIAFGIALVGCSSTGQSGGTTSDSNRIIVDSLSASVNGLSAYDVVEQHRSFWLRRRGEDSINNQTPIKVYLDNGSIPLGGVSSLNDVPATDIRTIEYFDARRAQMRFGLDNSSGAIVVNTKQGPGSS